jgi:hypothetical protein
MCPHISRVLLSSPGRRATPRPHARRTLTDLSTLSPLVALGLIPNPVPSPRFQIFDAPTNRFLLLGRFLVDCPALGVFDGLIVDLVRPR